MANAIQSASDNARAESNVADLALELSIENSIDRTAAIADLAKRLPDKIVVALAEAARVPGKSELQIALDQAVTVQALRIILEDLIGLERLAINARQDLEAVRRDLAEWKEEHRVHCG